MKKIKLIGEYIKLDQALKAAAAVPSGGEAKTLIQEGYVFVNGEKEIRRGKKLRGGDVVKIGDMEIIIV